MGTEKNFILECEAFKDNKESYAHILASIPWDIIFSVGFVQKSWEFIVKLDRKREEYKSTIEKQFVP